MTVAAGDWRAAVTSARDRLGLDFFDWLSAVDEGEAGFRIVVHLWSVADRRGLLLDTVTTDAGVASALVNAGQQVGGSIGTALLSTLAAGAAASHQGSADAAAVHGYTAAFGWAAAVFTVGSIAAWLLLPSEASEASPGIEPVFAH